MSKFYITVDDGKEIRVITPSALYSEAVQSLNELANLESCKVGIDALEMEEEQFTVFRNGRIIIYCIQKEYTLLSPKLFTQNINYN
jgi:hypothetical protein